MIYQPQTLGISIDEIKRLQQERLSPYANPFQWRSEYLPFIIGGVGVVGIALIMKKRKKKRGRKR